MAAVFRGFMKMLSRPFITSREQWVVQETEMYSKTTKRTLALETIEREHLLILLLSIRIFFSTDCHCVDDYKHILLLLLILNRTSYTCPQNCQRVKRFRNTLSFAARLNNIYIKKHEWMCLFHWSSFEARQATRF